MKKISAEKISKTFHAGPKSAGVLSKISSFLGGEDKKPVPVLNSISFECSSGEVIGLIGRNGSGKSTLLRLIAGIHMPDSGSIETNGQIMYLNGFNIGLNERLTMKDNIYLVGAIMNVSRKDIARKIPEITEFSGLRNFLDTKIYQFSSGMSARLGFSAVTSFIEERNPSIILLDEVLGSGGDEEFKEKAIQRMNKFLKGDATVILVSHDTKVIEKHCPRTMLLEEGNIVADGETESVVKKYLDILGIGKE